MATRRRSSQLSSPPNPPPSSSITSDTPTEHLGYPPSPSQSPPKGPLQGKIALVTGATGGIGKAICRRLAALGCSIGLHYGSDQDGALALLEEFKEQYMHVFGSKFVCYGADLGRHDEVHELHEHIVSLLGPPTILITNHGGAPLIPHAPSIESVSIAAFEATWRLNCSSSYLLTQLCMLAMEGEGWGRVVFVSSVEGMTDGSTGPHIASAEGAVQGLVHWLAGVYAGKGITVNGVAPARIAETEMMPGGSEELSKGIPVGRMGTPGEVADTVLWMINTPYVTNKIIAVDGGMVPQH